MTMQNSPARSTVDVGSVIAGTYTIEALIGRGGMGAVFLASHARLPGKKVAIKVLHAEMSGDEVLARFKREAQIASLLSHPNIVHIEDYNVTPEGMPYLVLEYLHGEPLSSRIRRGPMALDETFSIMRQVGSALAAAHAKGIVHRDLKPQNIFLVPSEIEGHTQDIAKVLDFGISKMRDSQTVKTQDSALLGTPQYMAPEQATGQHANVDERTDVFALGVIVYEMLSGQPAFSGASIPEVVFKVVYEQPVPLAQHVPSLPPPVLAAVHRAIAKPREERFANVAELIEALTGQPLVVARPSHSIPPPETGFATGSKNSKDTGRDAFAQTMGSGDHGTSPIAATAPSIPGAAAPSTAPAGHAATAAGMGIAPIPTTSPSLPAGIAPIPTTSPSLAAGIAPIPTTSPSLAAGEALRAAQTLDTLSPRPHIVATGSAPATPAKKPYGLVIGAVLATAALAGGAVYFAMSGKKHHRKPDDTVAATQPTMNEATPTERPTQTPTGSASASNETAAPSGSAASETAIPSGSASPSSGSAAPNTGTKTEPKTEQKTEPKTEQKTEPKAEPKTEPKKTEPKKTEPKKPPKADPNAESDDDADGDATAAQKLNEAESALRASEWKRAEQLANAVSNSEGAGPRQKARALLIHGTVQCLGNNNEEGARIDARRINLPVVRRKLVAVCRKAGMLLGD